MTCPQCKEPLVDWEPYEVIIPDSGSAIKLHRLCYWMRRESEAHMHTFESFNMINVLRCESPHGFNHKLNGWTLSDWMTAVTGELGEAANIVKKLNRVRDGVSGNKQTPEELQQRLMEEIGDVFIYLDLLATRAGFKIEDAIRHSFNAKSEELGCEIKWVAPQ